jgi:hypothetical protein
MIFFLQFVIVTLVMRLDPDPHHDGILYGAAVNVKNNGFPNRDAFAQYGPLVPEFQGLWLRIFGPSLFNIRFQAVLLFMISSVLIWYVAKVYFSQLNSHLISTAWLLTIPSVLPWPTIYSTILAILSLLLVVDLKRKELRTSHTRIFLASSLIAIGSFARIHLIAIFILIAIFFVIHKNHRIFLKYWLFGFTSTSSFILLFLFINDALVSFVSQSITWPILRYAGPDFSKSYVVGLGWYPLISLSFLSILGLISFVRSRKPYYSIFSILSVVIFVSLYAASKLEREGYLSLRNPKVLLIDFGRNMMNSLDYVTAFFILIFFFVVLFRFKSFNPMLTLCVFYATGILTQLYPLYDVNHLWLISPLLIIVSIAVLGDSRIFHRFFLGGLSITLLGLISALLIQIWMFTSIPRSTFESVSLRGMYAPSSFAKQLDQTMINLEKFVKPNSASFDCVNGLYAGAGGQYLASTRQFVNWGPEANSAKTGDLLFVCAIEENDISKYMVNGYSIVFKDPLTLFGDSEPRGFWNVLLKRN